MEKSAARLIVATYVGLLIAGPAPLGFASLVPTLFRSDGAAVIVLLGLLMLPWIIAGFVGGRSLGAIAALLGFLLLELPCSIRDIPLIGFSFFVVLVFFTGMIVSTFMGWVGGRLSCRLDVNGLLDAWRGWSVSAVVVLVLMLYVATIGHTVANHALRAEFPKDSLGQNPTQVHSYGAYIGVNRVPEVQGCDFADIYYTDPSGLIFLGVVRN